MQDMVGTGHDCSLTTPGDSIGVAIGQALSMPLAERRERYNSLFQVLSHNDIHHWADRFLSELDRQPRHPSALEQMPTVDTP